MQVILAIYNAQCRTRLAVSFMYLFPIIVFGHSRQIQILSVSKLCFYGLLTEPLVYYMLCVFMLTCHVEKEFLALSVGVVL